MIKGLLLILTVLVLTGCAPKHPVMVPLEEPLPGSFFTDKKKILEDEDLAAVLRAKDFILVGESHNNACDHLAQSGLIKTLAAAGHEFAVGLEMISVERQHVLDEFNARRTGVDQLPEKLDWAGTWGYDFELYRPIFDQTFRYSIPVFALNLPGSITRTISREGLDALSLDEKSFLPSSIIEPPEGQMEMLKKQFSLHQDMIQADEAVLQRFVTAQSVWDTKMAEEAVRIREELGRPVLILAGTGHVNRGYGIEHRLELLSPGARITSFVPARSLEGMTKDNPFYYFCPPVQERMRLGIVARVEDEMVMVRAVIRESLADEAGIQSGDRIVRAGAQTVTSLADLHAAAVEAVSSNGELELEILRDQETEIFLISF
ncbi:ChaN family lipoprotein [Desulfonatronovibrio hydrogenovorans]|uniref:ChaN family lipoprotein n=1 Tax=Desulfonatronovibrio hydrogenovorans TaxID=53245 RepID=UPI00068CFDD3|nr:ChaN family lipoprotein [Desulfonatronovibrio hydrogenovorans]